MTTYSRNLSLDDTEAVALSHALKCYLSNEVRKLIAQACECPSHLADLLLQVSYFEKYSSDCANRSAADAQLHAYLQQVAGTARMLFEKALEQVAIAEGLPLPLFPKVSSIQGA